MANKTQNPNKGRKPDWRTVQEKAYYRTGPNGQQIRCSQTIELAVGWNEIGQESGVPYISWADTVVPVFPDVDGRIVRRTFQIVHDEKK